MIRHVVMALALVACVHNDTSTPANVRAELVDSVRFENELIGVDYRRRVAVHRDGRVDTLANVQTSQESVVGGDSMVYGFLYDQQTVDGACRFEIRLDRSFGVGGGALIVEGSVDAIADVRVDTALRSPG